MKKSSFSKRLRSKDKIIKKAGLVVAAVALIGSSFTLASAQFTGGAGTFFAAAITAFNGNPLIAISRNASTPNGAVTLGNPTILATFDVRSKNVTNFANLNSIEVKVAAAGRGATTVLLSEFTMDYRYCIPAGVTYGYGYPGGSCGNIKLPVRAEARSGNTYIVSFSQPLPVYPVQSSGVLTFGATARSASNAKEVGGAATIQASISGSGSGDQCNRVTYGYQGKYGYTKCVSQKAIVSGASGNKLTLNTSYGYGYKPTTGRSCTLDGQTVANGSSATFYKTDREVPRIGCQSETRVCRNGTLSGSYQYAKCVPQFVENTKTYTVTGIVWIDSNSNGRKDLSEKSYGGGVVELMEAAVTPVKHTAAVGRDGRYIFSKLQADTYEMSYVAPRGYKVTTENPLSFKLTANRTQNIGIVVSK